jgi:hypothetical protein
MFAATTSARISGWGTQPGPAEWVEQHGFRWAEHDHDRQHGRDHLEIVASEAARRPAAEGG